MDFDQNKADHFQFLTQTKYIWNGNENVSIWNIKACILLTENSVLAGDELDAAVLP